MGNLFNLLSFLLVLHPITVKWWAGFPCQQALSWLAGHSNDSRNVSGVADCMQRINTCRYFKWVRGSCIHYWKIPVDDLHLGWLEEFRDGIKLMQLPGTTLPRGRHPNVKTETCEDELLTREKILRLRIYGYLEESDVKLVVPRFTVLKAGNDARVVWDSKANGHNACLWVPRRKGVQMAVRAGGTLFRDGQS
jgi:hypothetical protein